MSSELYSKADELFESVIKLLNNHSQSTILQNYFFDMVKSLFYANIIDNFFDNLTSQNIAELELSLEKLDIIKTKYKSVHDDAKSVIASSFINHKIDEKYYDEFRTTLKSEFPEIFKLIIELENKIEFNKASEYFANKRKELEKTGINPNDSNTFFFTKVIESYVQKEKSFPIEMDGEKLAKIATDDVLKKFSQDTLEKLKPNIENILKEEREFYKGFQERLILRWKEPLDLLEFFIRIAAEVGVQKRKKLSKINNNSDDAKKYALIQIHVRALQISSEILALVKTGFADGANARWRSLHELAVIAFFLKENNNEVSERFLKHEIIKKFKEAQDYQKYAKQLGYDPIDSKDLGLIQKERDNLIRRYGDEFKDIDFGWIPKSILKDRNFKALEDRVKLDKLRPFYNFSSNAIHGGPRGFHRLGLLDNASDLLAAGATNYGFADPIQNTAISLLHVTANLLVLEPDFEGMLQAFILHHLVGEISKKAVNVQKEIEDDEKNNPHSSPSGFVITSDD